MHFCGRGLRDDPMRKHPDRLEDPSLVGLILVGVCCLRLPTPVARPEGLVFVMTVCAAPGPYGPRCDVFPRGSSLPFEAGLQN